MVIFPNYVKLPEGTSQKKNSHGITHPTHCQDSWFVSKALVALVPLPSHSRWIFIPRKKKQRPPFQQPTWLLLWQHLDEGPVPKISPRCEAWCWNISQHRTPFLWHSFVGQYSSTVEHLGIDWAYWQFSQKHRNCVKVERMAWERQIFMRTVLANKLPKFRNSRKAAAKKAGLGMTWLDQQIAWNCQEIAGTHCLLILESPGIIYDNLW